jgi:3-oxocholest-4-en-26-oyl-CoA dehydrogenase alpha subunit
MDLGFTAEQEAFRGRVSAFLRQSLPAEFGLGSDEGRDDEDYFAAARRFMEQLSEKGWLVFGWPVEYGGGGASVVEQAILAEELGYYGVPPADTTGRTIAGPAIMRFGTEEQKQRYLLPIARGEVVWCQGFSEPNAGSDLASVRMTALRDGDEYVINGQKVFTSRAAWADFIYLLARTDPNAPRKHQGLSMFLIPMSTPGITVRPLHNFTHSYPQNEVFFDDVRVPADSIVGAEGEGWTLATATLSFERVNLSDIGRARRLFEEFLDLCRQLGKDGSGPLDSALTRSRIAQCAVEFESWRLLCWRVVAMQASGALPTFEPSLSNVIGKDYRQHAAKLVVDVLGQYAVLEEGSPLAPLSGRLLHQYLYSVNKHGQGTSEVQRDVIAYRGLGLPRTRA